MKRESKKYKDKEWLRDKYVEENLSLKEIAEICDVSHKTISNWKIRYDIGDKDFNKIEKECCECGKSIERRPSMFEGENAFCSNDCKNKYRDQKVSFACEFCGEEDEKVPSQIHDRNFCSVDCRTSFFSGENHGMSNRTSINCDNCNSKIDKPKSHINENNNFCDESCYYEYLSCNDERNSNKAKEWRNEIRNRDNWTCQDCGERREQIEAHHIEKWEENEELRFCIDNGVSLCLECHYLRHEENGDKVETRLMQGRVDLERVKNLR
jgi:hypothetical protein